VARVNGQSDSFTRLIHEWNQPYLSTYLHHGTSAGNRFTPLRQEAELAWITGEYTKTVCPIPALTALDVE